MIVAEVLSADDPVQIRLEQFLDEVDLVECVVRVWLNDVEDRDDLAPYSAIDSHPAKAADPRSR